MTPSIPANTAMPIACRISKPAPVENTSGTTPMMNATDVISTGRSRTRHASRIACDVALAFVLALPGELDDQDRVLAGEPREHEEADLREDVVVAAGQPDAGDRARAASSARSGSR